MRDIVERLELQAFVADKIQSGMKPLIMDCLEEITHLRCQYEALHKQGEMNARLLTENAELRERLAEADEANRRVSDENAKLRDELITSSDAAKYYDYGYSCARDMQKDEITRLRAENEKLREALKPFAVDSLMDDAPTLADYRAARKALESGDE